MILSSSGSDGEGDRLSQFNSMNTSMEEQPSNVSTASTAMSSQTEDIKIAHLNARSLQNYESKLKPLLDYQLSRGLDILVATETWRIRPLGTESEEAFYH